MTRTKQPVTQVGAVSTRPEILSAGKSTPDASSSVASSTANKPNNVAVNVTSERVNTKTRGDKDTDLSASASTCVNASADLPTASTTPLTSGGNSAYKILVNKKQKGNPILKFVRNVPWEFDAIIPDYDLGAGVCALYLSVKYHNRFPDYIHNRLKELGKSYSLRIVLVQVDTKQQDISHELGKLAKMCIMADCTLMLAFSYEEAGRYLEVYKAYENKPPTDIMGKSKTDFLSQATEFLTAVKGVNKTDVTTLLSRFKTIGGIIEADVDSLSLCAGIGPVKARRLRNAFTTPFVKQRSSPSKRTAEPDQEEERAAEDYEGG